LKSTTRFTGTRTFIDPLLLSIVWVDQHGRGT
jgi:hypothetical protein